MPYPNRMVYIRYEFRFGTVEIQDTGLWCAIEADDPDNVVPQQLVDNVAARAVDAWAQNFDIGFFSGGVQATRAIAYLYGPTLKDPLARGEAPFDGANTWAGGSAQFLPAQCAVVLSTYAYDPALYAPAKKSRRGRMYLPTPAADSLGADGRLTEARRDSLLLDARDWYTDLTADLDIGDEQGKVRPNVLSRTTSSLYQWQYFRVGRVIDTQRKRRNKLNEAYAIGPVANP